MYLQRLKNILFKLILGFQSKVNHIFLLSINNKFTSKIRTIVNYVFLVKNTSKTDQPNEITLEERTVLNAVLELDDNPSLAQRVSLDEIYLTNMAIATLNHSATIESYFKSKHKHDIIEAIVLEDDKQINKAQNSIQETANGISMRTKRTKLVKKISTIGRPKSYDIEELGDLYMDGCK